MTAVRFCCLACLAVGVVAFASNSPTSAPQQTVPEKKAIVPTGANAGMLTPGIMIGNTLYLSGQLPSGAVRDSGIAVQAKSAIENAGNVLKAAGLDYSDVVAVTIFLTDVADFQAMNGAYRAIFTADPKPTRTTVVVKELVTAGMKIEITMTAVKTK